MECLFLGSYFCIDFILLNVSQVMCFLFCKQSIPRTKSLAMDVDLQMDFAPDGYYTDDAAHEKISGYDNNQYQYVTEDDLSQEIIRLVCFISSFCSWFALFCKCN
jgi:RNase adaptor protein for sRNA GlmZ degradation